MRIIQKLEKVVWDEFAIETNRKIDNGITYTINDTNVSEQDYLIAKEKLAIFSNEPESQKQLIFKHAEYLPVIVRAEERTFKNMYFVLENFH